MTFERSDLVLLRKVIKTSLGVATMINIPKLDHERLIQLMDDIDDELEFGVKDNGKEMGNENHSD